MVDPQRSTSTSSVATTAIAVPGARGEELRPMAVYPGLMLVVERTVFVMPMLLFVAAVVLAG